jgi:hypothetical protein
MPFPISPTNGQQATVNGILYVYNSTKGGWIKVPSTLSANPAISNGTSNVTVASGGDITVVRAGVTVGTFGVAGLAVNGITTAVLTTGAVGTTGTVTGNWSLTSGSRLEATYADLAEYYRADADYEPGTVLEIGGEHEVTVASVQTTRVAGIVSMNPAYLLNNGCPGDHVVAIALQGRVHCKVTGKVEKGDILVSAGNGYAMATKNPAYGTVIGRALENFDRLKGMVEVKVDRF